MAARSRVIANRRGFLRGAEGPRVGGIIYTESARKVHYFVEHAERAGTPLIYVQDVSRLHGRLGRRERAASYVPERRWWNPCPAPPCPRIILTINHASGAGYYAMAGQGFDPELLVSAGPPRASASWKAIPPWSRSFPRNSRS